MKRTIDPIIADPAGNITILVLTPVDRSDYQRVAHVLLEEYPQAEQVGYVLAAGPDDAYPRMEMCGLEFCGNASRAFAFYEAICQEPPVKEIDVQVSGCDHPLHAWLEADGREGVAKIQMPVPTDIENIEIRIPAYFSDFADGDRIKGRLVHMDGISHLIISSISRAAILEAGRERMNELFVTIRDSAYEITGIDFPAFGVMFVDREADHMTPVVYVRDVDTVYFEGSCASGSTAAAYALAVTDLERSDFVSYRLNQPAGTLYIDIAGEGGRAREIRLYGSISVSDVKELEIEFD